MAGQRQPTGEHSRRIRCRDERRAAHRHGRAGIARTSGIDIQRDACEANDPDRPGRHRRVHRAVPDPQGRGQSRTDDCHRRGQHPAYRTHRQRTRSGGIDQIVNETPNDIHRECRAGARQPSTDLTAGRIDGDLNPRGRHRRHKGVRNRIRRHAQSCGIRLWQPHVERRPNIGNGRRAHRQAVTPDRILRRRIVSVNRGGLAEQQRQRRSARGHARLHLIPELPKFIRSTQAHEEGAVIHRRQRSCRRGPDVRQWFIR